MFPCRIVNVFFSPPDIRVLFFFWIFGSSGIPHLHKLICWPCMGAPLDAHIHPQTPTQYVVNSYLLYTQTLTNATRYPQFQYRINILVDTPGVALPVFVQSSFGFLTTHLDTQHRFDACSKHFVLCTGGIITPPTRWTDYLTAVFAHVSGVYRTAIQCWYRGRRPSWIHLSVVMVLYYISQRPGRSRHCVSS